MFHIAMPLWVDDGDVFLEAPGPQKATVVGDFLWFERGPFVREHGVKAYREACKLITKCAFAQEREEVGQ